MSRPREIAALAVIILASIGVMIAYFVTIGFLPSAMTYFRPPLPPRTRRPKKGEPRADRGCPGRG